VSHLQVAAAGPGDPEVANHLHNIGQNYYEKGRFEEALGWVAMPHKTMVKLGLPD